MPIMFIPPPQGAAQYRAEITEDAIAAGLDAAVAALDDLKKVRIHPRVVVGVRVDECFLDFRGQRALITLECKHVVALLIDDLLGDLGV